VKFSAFKRYAAVVGLSEAVTPEPQTSDYESGVVLIEDELWHIRTARTTPKKQGAFVAFWRRDADGNTAPFTEDDPSAGLLVFIEDGGNRGLFRFTREHLAELGITEGRQAGKRGFRVYPMWCTDLNAQATSTQRAQASAFQEY
jgi:hypothetical protein